MGCSTPSRPAQPTPTQPFQPWLTLAHFPRFASQWQICSASRAHSVAKRCHLQSHALHHGLPSIGPRQRRSNPSRGTLRTTSFALRVDDNLRLAQYAVPLARAKTRTSTHLLTSLTATVTLRPGHLLVCGWHEKGAAFSTVTCAVPGKNIFNLNAPLLPRSTTRPRRINRTTLPGLPRRSHAFPRRKPVAVG